jgi:hypothetical protein
MGTGDVTMTMPAVAVAVIVGCVLVMKLIRVVFTVL